MIVVVVVQRGLNAPGAAKCSAWRVWQGQRKWTQKWTQLKQGQGQWLVKHAVKLLLRCPKFLNKNM